MISSPFSSPIDSCLGQSKCLHVSDCDVEKVRRVCISLIPSSVCLKLNNPLTDESDINRREVNITLFIEDIILKMDHVFDNFDSEISILYHSLS